MGKVPKKKEKQNTNRQQENLFFTAFNLNPNGIILTTIDQGIIETNEKFLEMMALSREEVIGKDSVSLNLLPDPGKRAEAVELLKTRGYISGFETEMVNRLGIKRTMLISIRKLPLEQEAYLTVFQDITEQKKQEEKRNRERELMSTVLSSIPVMITVYDPETDTITFNKEFERLTGWAIEEVKNTSIIERVFPDPVYRKKISDFMQREKGWREIILTTKDGSEIETSWANIKLHDGRQIGIGLDIREQKNIEKILRESQERLKRTLDHLMEGCAIIGYDWKYIYLNESHARHARNVAAKMNGRNMLEVIPGLENSDFFRAFKESMEKRTRKHIESKFVFEDGSTGWYEAIAQPVPEGIFIFSIDITEKKKAEESSILLQRLLQSTMDNFPSVIVFKDKEGRFIDFNKVVEKTLGKTRNEILGLTDYDLFPGDMADVYRKNDLKVMESRQPLQREEVTILPEKKLYHLDISFPLLDTDGNVYGVGHISYDLTDLKLTEESLRRREKILSLILNHINEGIIVSEAPDGKIAAISLWGINHTLGKSHDDVLNLPVDRYLEQWDVRDINTREKVDPERLPISRALKGETIEAEEWLMVRPDGSSFTTVVNAVPVYNSDKSAVTGAVATWMDISKLEEAYSQIEERLREKEVLLRELYHRTKNNMQLISSLISLKASALQGENGESAIEDMQKRIRSIALVHEKLYQSKNLSRINLKEYILELVLLLMDTHSGGESRIKLKYELEEIRVLIDTAVPCGLIITELVLNSLKYAFPGSREGYINIVLKRTEDQGILLNISDNGVGMQDNYNGRQEGLGLILFREIARNQMHAEIEMKNEHGVSWDIRFKDIYHFERV